MVEIPATVFPRPLDAYPPPADTLLATFSERNALEPFNLVATTIFFLAIIHTFAAARFTTLAHTVQRTHDAHCRARGVDPTPSVGAGLLRFFGEVEVVFGLWAAVLFWAIAGTKGWTTAQQYFNGVTFTEPLFVVVIMALASTRPIINVAEDSLRFVARLGGGTPAAWWIAILTIGPLLGSFITEPAAMTISALLLAHQFFALRPSARLKYATLGLLFVNVSIGGTLTHFAAPPVLMVARPWDWDTPFMLGHFGWRALIAIIVSTAGYYAVFRKELRAIAEHANARDIERPDEEDAGAPQLLPAPAWITITHMLFMAWTVFTSHYPALFLGGFMFFLGFVTATSAYQSRIDLKAPLLVGFFLAGLVIHGGLQAWWISPVLASFSEARLFLGATLLTAFNDNALITYLGTLVPNLDQPLRIAIVEGAVTGGGLTVIANAPNPAGQALLSRFFDGAVLPLRLLLGALPPTVVAAVAFRVL